MSKEYYLSNLEAKLAYRDKPFSLTFNSKINFLIGPNGCGKTTVINLINNIISVNLHALFQSSFLHARLVFKNKNIKYRSYFVVIIEKNNNREQDEITFIINQSGENVMSFVFDAHGILGRSIHERSPFSNFLLNTEKHSDRITKDLRQKKIQDFFKSLLNLTWLPVDRDDGFGGNGESSSVNKRLASVVDRMSSYRTNLRQREAEQNHEFQKELLAALILKRENKNKRRASKESEHTNKSNISSQKMMMISMFESMDIDKHLYESGLDELFSRIESFTDEKNNKEGKENEMLIHTLNTIYKMEFDRLSAISEFWLDKNEKINRIYKSIYDLEGLIEKTLKPKRLSFDEFDNPFIYLNDNRKIPFTSLSSGEKQIIILLFEATLQFGQPSLFMVDEPELSIHMMWQESLVDNILALNPYTQIIFATHSPDVVSRYANNTINIGEY